MGRFRNLAAAVGLSGAALLGLGCVQPSNLNLQANAPQNIFPDRAQSVRFGIQSSVRLCLYAIGAFHRDTQQPVLKPRISCDSSLKSSASIVAEACYPLMDAFRRRGLLNKESSPSQIVTVVKRALEETSSMRFTCGKSQPSTQPSSPIPTSGP